ncbi:MAG: threonine synthase [Halieaceae bacterium]|jgi:threonine synthase|nr:threonine synthase [Halieaceae bacterium]
MRYISTRGSAPSMNFEEVLLAGLARDGGLYVPESLPKFSPDQIRAMRGLPYNLLAFEIIQPFVAGCVEDADLKRLIDESYAEFRHAAVAPLVQLDTNQWVLELFHGPTLAFKDFALQLLGRLLDHVLERRGEKVVIMGATSGDTGSAAIEGCRHCSNIDIFILYPHGAVSEVQRRQMTTVPGDNIHNLAIEGNFDDCQAMVKASFVADPFLPEDRSLVAVNSINWARIMAQIVYYFYAAVALGGPDRPVSFSVPTGNFGDIFAGYLARQMGLPIDQLVIATNRNDVLHRVLTTGRYARQSLEKSLSPSMDITVSSNFERLIFDLYGRDGERVAQLMHEFDQGAIALDDAAMAEARALFASSRVSDEETCAEIASVWAHCEYLLDPHTAIGVRAARDCQRDCTVPMVTLATAHPAKFPDAIARSVEGMEAALPPHLADLFARPERSTVLPNDLSVVQQFMAEHVNA